ncbi:MAG: hypothetical protein A3B99_03415 [Candidatus Yanofskybacteria bacterium RIFCSPHIGHO2_02_FULL_44_12b]|uniref:Uncharacterized protein n=2 Tax=Candidatus Yanofskyibacteriota TaxID=1752733 RepID=A0A1F8GLP9_9BACT|nr:MAG: hypothetical protein UW79_C0017G0012 [Candidatus Yanofskybacteria bacterium GW2011_GWA2_44_9]OGN05022.1 MAG: hypothetical protein A2659_02615 [Candidatus Yanofskybacteria bacterium RIFCSPHIGHO2_01_FULL_44_24]OGN13973.1 MAG: hypothetical protein A3B99_03415 [Candidatus Yanofskybacteria bacterium RIFCSPHIGHO2_02_FULL_44_12b]OGN26337.1 MAG: hypothetical protein A2925_00390 [Candidatus Yanofskybacteria bacterium RIFCSPLOWO2_01_FULL_44_22]
MKNYLLIVLFFLLTGISYAAQPSPNADFESLSYAARLYFDNGKLFADRDYEVKYEIVESKFVQEVVTTPFPYRFEVIGFNNKVISSFQFDPRKGNPTFNSGKITVYAPYAPDGFKIDFLDNASRQILSLFVSDSSFCDDDNICEESKGENEKTCSNDCRAGRTPVPTVNVSLPRDEGGFGITALITYIVAGLAALGVAWFGWRWWKGRGARGLLSPEPLPSSIVPPPQSPFKNK